MYNTYTKSIQKSYTLIFSALQLFNLGICPKKREEFQYLENLSIFNQNYYELSFDKSGIKSLP
ncbi:hypothetical protein SAMN05661096_00384 [Marivirga sericea]|uniref:Uncharacterized protein n=1 Tax=Marivirga sericea TaxID=1028 RepID=A0A1X7I993_9BACT|nr:hypothetical protein SAMN05661096_00384 [Marivirga sericea]